MNLKNETLQMLDKTPRTRVELAKLTGVDREWLAKFHQRRIPNPGVLHVQAVYDFLITDQSTAA